MKQVHRKDGKQSARRSSVYLIQPIIEFQKKGKWDKPKSKEQN